MPTNIYLSMGQPSTPEQERFMQFMTTYLQANQFSPLTAGYTYVDNQQPLKSVRDCMRTCSGVLVLACERTHIEKGEERRGSSEAKDLSDVTLPTVWNHMEGAMAIALGKPLLVLCQKGLKEEGVLEDKYEEWRVKRIPLDKSIVSDSDFIAKFEYWKKQVEQYRQSPAVANDADIDAGSLTIGGLIRILKPAQFWSVLAALGGIAVAAAGIAFKIGSSLPKVR